MTEATSDHMAVPGTHLGSRAEYAARKLQQLAEQAEPGEHLGTKVALRALCGVSVGTFNEAVKLAQSRGFVVSRSGPGGGIFAAERSPIARLGNSVLALDGSATSVADAVRMRDALDPLLVDDALWHSSATDIRTMRECLQEMATARDSGDAVAFVHANWALHRRIAEVSPSAILRSVYVSLLELIQAHTRGVGGTETQPLPEYVAARYLLHERLVDAIEARDQAEARRLIHEHNNTETAR
ncbi:FadR/GntR family transcriptional regulator [Amycolatopsis sp. MEPSY49]|uniref:FadR/GntR family transcriptional regulator n=1 Tax=Amycolatopsis sp. MEPSY49 TaxID=3151600 RepID=UPI003EF1ED43